jgi:predicted dehydrogenase
LVDSKKKIRVGLVGAGRQGRRHAIAMSQSDNTELVVVADVNHDAARILADDIGCEATPDWSDVVGREDINAVVVCTPPHLHKVISVAAANSGKHVLCEKPLARDPEEAEEIVAAARENAVKLRCGFNLRYHPGIRQAREWIDQGVIGELSFIRCRYGIGGRPGYDREWRADPEIAGGGQLMDQGMHALDLVDWFLGDISEVVGFLSTSFWDIAPLEDNVFALLRTPTGQTASIHASWTQWKNLFALELFGRDGYALVEGLGGSYGTERAVLGKRAFLEPFREEIIDFRGEDRSWHEQWKEFVNAADGSRETSTSSNDGLRAMKLAYAVYESAKKSRVVQVKE